MAKDTKERARKAGGPPGSGVLPWQAARYSAASMAAWAAARRATGTRNGEQDT